MEDSLARSLRARMSPKDRALIADCSRHLSKVSNEVATLIVVED